jgi:hypothetical protein
LQDVPSMLATLETELFWDHVDGIFSLEQSKLDAENKITTIDKVIAVKVFVNKETQEVRQFVSKYTDEPQTQVLV